MGPACLISGVAEPGMATFSDEIQKLFGKEEEALNEIEALSKLTPSELEKRFSQHLYNLIITSEKGSNGYFLENGVEKIKKHYPEQLEVPLILGLVYQIETTLLQILFITNVQRALR